MKIRSNPFISRVELLENITREILILPKRLKIIESNKTSRQGNASPKGSCGNDNSLALRWIFESDNEGARAESRELKGGCRGFSILFS